MRHRLIVGFGILLAAGFSAPLSASAPRQEIPPLRKAVESYLRSETAGYPGQVSFSLGPIDPYLNLPACQALEPFVPAGNRLWGQATVGVRCGQGGWTLYVPVSIKVVAPVVHAIKPLAQGRLVDATDIALQPADLAQLPAGILTDAMQATGKMLASNIAAGQPLRQDLLRAPSVIQQGQTVQLRVQGRGYSVSSEGRALTAAAEGQVVQVRVQSGQIISGIARVNAIVEVQPR